MGLLCIIAVNEQHFRHICHLYRIEKDQVRRIKRSSDLYGLPSDSIIIFGEEWWRGRQSDEIEKIEYLVKEHNKKRCA